MSKAAPTVCKKKTTDQTSTESSSGSSSDSSSSSSSSSGSDSSTSSDSDTSSSHSSKQLSGSENSKKSNSPQKVSRKVIENKGGNKSTEKVLAKTKPVSSKLQKQISKASIYSSEDEQATSKQTNKPVVKKKVIPKAKTKAGNALGKNGSAVTNKTSQVSKSNNKISPVTKNIKALTKTNVKPQNKTKEKQKNMKMAEKLDLNKKKSIFSPENSSESESESKNSSKTKTIPAKPRPKATAKVIEKSKPPEVKPKPELKSGPKSKAIISSASSGTSSSGSNTSSSDSETSLESSSEMKGGAVKKPVKKPIPKEMNSDSETEAINDKQVTRKLTRSASTRKSKHVVPKSTYSDTDSDTESVKRSLSRSPVKRAPVSTKGKTKNKRSDSKKNNENIVEERTCPIETCNSLGHLGGKLDRHFTVDACPNYHNVTMTECKEMFNDRKKREENRKKVVENIKKSPKAQAIQEQKLYQQKIKDLRKLKLEVPEDVKPNVDKNREPDLMNFVSDYDLKLFRDAQAVASEKIEEELKTQPNTKGTKYIEMGKFEMEVWYQSPYPEDYARLPKLYICEYCLRYMKSRTILQRHVHKCVWRHPPGEEVYRKDKISVWEVDGKRYKSYCQNLCLLAKFFLDHKTLYYDVEPFLFYVMTLVDNEGCHTVGYFSKEKNSFLNYNVSCILTLPPYQRQGYGRLLIDFSYLLTRVEGKIGSPEKPLSDLGLISYRSYWKDVLLNYLCKTAGTQLSVKDISQEMAIHSYDIVSTLQALGMMKYWKGKHIILRKQDVLDEYVERVKRRGPLLKEVDPTCLKWAPFVSPQANPA